MWNAANLAEYIHHDAKDYGFDLKVNNFSLESLKASRDNYIKRLNGIYRNNLEKDKVQLIEGFASFASKDKVLVNGLEYSAKHILIATGNSFFLEKKKKWSN